ncbi:hypothetical protein [Candidatus Manganitrophus noduliformans]|uniref:DUF4124 domain-containing protein n=1 Tax=Candidatus Manganitrophus noduliformans TaxID=2606439 RepID=A0A7X6DRR0_9BACT|nr:hypothetical protein [Candidatus Manganitrophus noduliformans]NKE71868.1 hypothetical protein [Candidatus Manganitrophus noduliformans]
MTYPLFIRSILSLLLIAALSSPAPAELYSWRDAEGVLHATDRRDKVPEGVTPEVWPDLPPSPPAEAPQVLPPQPKAEPPPSQEFLPAAEVEAAEVTQGAFAVQLVRELGLEEDADPEEAADLLTRIRVTPRLGRWELSAPMTPALVSRLRTLTVSAAQRGAVQIAPEEALLAFDTTAALLNVSIPAASEADLSDRPASSTYLDAPPLVLISPPPPRIVSYYVWVPVEEGFSGRVPGAVGFMSCMKSTAIFISTAIGLLSAGITSRGASPIGFSTTLSSIGGCSMFIRRSMTAVRR